jgi:Holliday junction resolvasome RuvABC endonuclease subunit
MIRTKRPIPDVTILTNDPSFTAWGWAVLDTKDNVLATGCIKTEPEHKKRRTRVSDDRANRAATIVRYLRNIIEKYNVCVILTEAPHGSQNANAAVMIGVVMGITTTLAECLSLPIEYYSEQDAKKELLGKKTATKDETIAAVGSLYEYDITGIKYVDEAVADSLAIHNVARHVSPLLKMMKNG